MTRETEPATASEATEDVVPFLPSGRPTPRDVIASADGSLALRTPTRLVDLMGHASGLAIAGPVLVSEAGSPLEDVLPAIVYPLASMTALPAPPGQRLADEIARFLVGRTSANDIVIDDLSVSKKHASIVRQQDDRWCIVDDGSSNGTFVDGQRLQPGAIGNLGVLATLRFGPKARCVFMRPTMFGEYLESLRIEVARRRLLPPILLPAIPTDRDRFDRVRMTAPGGTLEPLAARIIARLRTAPAALAYRVELEDGLRVELKTLSEVIALVTKSPERVLRVDATLQDGAIHSILTKG
jgi:pSer/pThr/pTyr-binding forkhead associated (FHA) protein